MNLPLVLRLHAAAVVTLFAAITVLPAALAVLCWALPAPRRRRTGTIRGALLVAGPAGTPSRRGLGVACAVHWRGFAARRHGLSRLTFLLAAPSTTATLAAGRLLPWHVTITTPEAVANVTRRSKGMWVLTNLARLPGDRYRGAGAALLCQILTAASAVGATVQLTADSDKLLAYYRRYGFRPAPGARSPRRMTASPARHFQQDRALDRRPLSLRPTATKAAEGPDPVDEGEATTSSAVKQVANAVHLTNRTPCGRP